MPLVSKCLFVLTIWLDVLQQERGITSTVGGESLLEFWNIVASYVQFSLASLCVENSYNNLRLRTMTQRDVRVFPSLRQVPVRKKTGSSELNILILDHKFEH